MKKYFALILFSLTMLLSVSYIVNENVRYERMDDHELITHTDEHGIHSSIQNHELEKRGLIQCLQQVHYYHNLKEITLKSAALSPGLIHSRYIVLPSMKEAGRSLYIPSGEPVSIDLLKLRYRYNS